MTSGAGEIHVDFNALGAGQSGIQATYSQLTSTLDTLESDLQPMIQSWTGSAQEAYLQCKKQWDDAAQALAQVLQGIGSAVGNANDNYQQAENAARGAWS